MLTVSTLWLFEKIRPIMILQTPVSLYFHDTPLLFSFTRDVINVWSFSGIKVEMQPSAFTSHRLPHNSNVLNFLFLILWRSPEPWRYLGIAFFVSALFITVKKSSLLLFEITKQNELVNFFSSCFSFASLSISSWSSHMSERVFICTHIGRTSNDTANRSNFSMNTDVTSKQTI